MPARYLPLVTGHIYHVVNRGTGLIPIFNNARDYKRFISLANYYRNREVPIRFSKLLTLSHDERKKILKETLAEKNFWVEIIAYCLMPNHYHFLLKQKQDNGIQNFIRLTTNSYSKYFNIKNGRKGTLFEGRFGAVLIQSEEQLLHTSRYIHLNPYSSFLVKNAKDIFNYQYSSLPEYLEKTSNGICKTGSILSHFSTREKYKKFLLDQADYQRSLEKIKHLSLD